MDKRVGDWKSKGSKVNRTNWPEWVCSQLYTLFPITPQCLEAFFLPYKLNLNDYSQRTNGSVTKFSAKKSHVFFCWVCHHEELRRQKSRWRPNGMSLSAGHSIGAKELQWLSVEPFQPGSFRRSSKGVGWGAVVGWEFPWWFKGSLGNSPAAKGRKILILAREFGDEGYFFKKLWNRLG